MKDYENAIVNLDKAIILCPEFPAANYNKGTVYKSMGKFDKAISAYKEAIKNKENYYEAYNSLAAMYIKTKEFKEAESILDNLIASNNQNSKAYYNKACLFSLQKNKEFALIYLEKAIKLDSELKKAAIKDEDFSWLKETEEFIALSS
ncbi:MAG: tetratricopeptide repeat protein [Saprospiraceae bacterium]|nr:tetratricopeptide repeat protein [Saprospiraceae bacterium]